MLIFKQSSNFRRTSCIRRIRLVCLLANSSNLGYGDSTLNHLFSLKTPYGYGALNPLIENPVELVNLYLIAEDDIGLEMTSGEEEGKV